MEFEISRASYSKRHEKPCEKAIDKGKREFSEEHIWAVQINTLQDLLDLINETNCGIILYADSITIYDDYVE